MLRFATLLLSFFLVNTGVDSGLIIKIPPGIALSEQEVRPFFRDNPRNAADSRETIEIVIYSFSLGIEKITYSENDPIRISLQKGEIRALIKLKKNSILKKVLFVNADGTSKDEILKNFSLTLSNSLRNQ
jgi:hypothetical protein